MKELDDIWKLADSFIATASHITEAAAHRQGHVAWPRRAKMKKVTVFSWAQRIFGSSDCSGGSGTWAEFETAIVLLDVNVDRELTSLST
ncbi:hypothetical protein IF2G_08509 [Cordyceps javanica]|nr:hypothetical protein IF2G_08509 [Cordyceps javanica]